MILVVDLNWKKDSLGYFEFVLPIVTAVEMYGESATVRHYSEVGAEDFSQYSGIILSGTTLKDNQALSEAEKFVWLKIVNKPVLGICAGMQTLAAVWGLVLTRCLEIGMTKIATLNSNNLFSGSFQAYTLHNFSVESSDEFEVLAESPKCLQAIKHKQKPLYGVLFHPEVRNLEVIRNFLKLCCQSKKK